MPWRLALGQVKRKRERGENFGKSRRRSRGAGRLAGIIKVSYSRSHSHLFGYFGEIYRFAGQT